MKKFLLLAVFACFAVGCTPLHPSDCHKTTALGSCDSGRYTDQDEYGKQARVIKEAIESKLNDRYAWKGKKCRLHLEFANNGELKHAEAEGNKAYCEALKTAAGQATFPPFINQKVYSAFERSWFDLKGE